MKLTRATNSCFDKFLTYKKKEQLDLLMTEYARVCNAYIGRFQKEIPMISKIDLMMANKLHIIDSWLSARMKKNAMSEAYGMVQSAKSNAQNKLIERQERKQKRNRAIEKGKHPRKVKQNTNYVRPIHHGKKIILSETVASINVNTKLKEFDLMVTIGNIGNKMKIAIPLKKHEHFNKYSDWKLAKSITVHKNNIQFTFSKEQSKKDSGKAIGIDFGINKFMATSTKEIFGIEYKNLLSKLWRKKKHSKAWIKCKEEIKEYIDKTIKDFPFHQYGLIVVEKLNKIHHKMKLKRRLSKSIRRLVSTWNYRYIYDKLFRECDNNGVRYSQVLAYNNSNTCPIPSCGHTNKKNRLSQEQFCCLKCGFSDNADFTSANVALRRRFLGTYGSQFKAFEGQYGIN